MERTPKTVTMTLMEPLLGTVPKNQEVYAAYIATKAPKPELADEEVETVQEIEDKGWTGFHTDADGPLIYDYQVKGFLKEIATVLQAELGIKGLKSKIEKYVYVLPRRIRLPAIADKPMERPLRASTAQGERVTVTRSDQVAPGGQITLQIMLIPNSSTKQSKAVTWKTVEALLDFGALKGLGQWRSGGFGRFTWGYASKGEAYTVVIRHSPAPQSNAPAGRSDVMHRRSEATHS